MKNIGILGGMAPESTLEFYRRLTKLSQEKLSERRYPTTIVYSLNMEEFRRPLKSGDYPGAISILLSGIQSLAEAGADFVVIASNTPHMFFQELAEKSPIPLLSVVEEVAKEADRFGFTKVGLYGTMFTMEGDFYRKGLEEHGVSVVSPREEARSYIHKKTMGELADGKILESTQEELVEICQEMVQERDIQALVLGSTELSLILDEEVLGVPVLDTTEISVESAFNLAQE